MAEQGSMPAGRPGEDALRRLCAGLEGWGTLLREAAERADAAAFEQVLGGLVDWMGNELLDGWLHLPIPVFEALSGLAEELLSAGQACHAAMRAVPPTVPPVPQVQRIGEILQQAGALRTAG